MWYAVEIQGLYRWKSFLCGWWVMYWANRNDILISNTAVVKRLAGIHFERGPEFLFLYKVQTALKLVFYFWKHGKNDCVFA